MADNVPPAQAPLGSGILRGVARLLRKRPMEEDDAIEAQQGADTTESPNSVMPEAGGQGFIKERSPAERARRQAELEQMLKNRR
jgi:hypothetical protein